MRRISSIVFVALVASWSIGFERTNCSVAQQIVPLESSRYLYGSMEAAERQFRFLIELKPSGVAELTSLDEGNSKFRLDDFEWDDTNLKFKIKSTRAEYLGTKGEENFDGTWNQHGNKIGLNFVAIDSVPTDQPSEIWVGELNAGVQKLEIQIRGYKQDDGSTRYFFDSLTQQLGGFMGRGTNENNRLQLEFPALGAKYDGEIDTDGQQIEGKFTQGLTLELNLARSESLKTAKHRNRPQTPKPPFPYEVRDVKFPANDGKIELAGTLTYPSNGEKFPLAIMITGSGPQDRDETIFEHKPFLVIADHLTRNGIAVLRYDERGVGGSQGNFATATSMNFADDVTSAVQFAKTLPEIDPNKIGLIGHSEGGIVAPLVAANDSNIAFIVLLAGTGVNGEQILFSQGRLIAQAEGVTEDKLQQLQKGQELIFVSIKQMKPEEKLADSIKEKTQTVFDGLKSQLPELADDEKNIKGWIAANLAEMDKPWFRFFATHEPAPVLEKIKCPVLAINGEKDLQVDPKLNLPEIEKALTKGGNPDFQIVELPGLNHLFQTSDTGAISQYIEIEETIAPAALEIVTDWIQQRMLK